MGSRTLPSDCPVCGLVNNWGDFGPDPDNGSVGTHCACPVVPKAVIPEAELVRLRAVAEAAHELCMVADFVVPPSAQPLLVRLRSALASLDQETPE